MPILSKIASNRSPLAGVMVSVLLGATSPVALAQTPPPAAPSGSDRTLAESLFIEARRLMGEQRYAEACPKFEESNRLDPAGGTLLNLAVCHEGEGKLATAWSEFRQSLTIARREQRGEREKLASEHIAALEPRLPRLTVDVPTPSRVPGLVVRVNQSPLGSAAWGSALPVDPGDALIEASAPGRKAWSTKLRIAEGRNTTATVPILEAAPAAPASSSAPPLAVSIAPTSQPPIASSTGRDATTYSLLGVGVLGLGLGTFFGVRALTKKSDSDDACPQNRCTAHGVDLNDQARTSARIADIALGVGVVAAGAGLYLLLTRPSGPADGPAVSLSFAPLPRGGGAASLGGSF